MHGLYEPSEPTRIGRIRMPERKTVVPIVLPPQLQLDSQSFEGRLSSAILVCELTEHKIVPCLIGKYLYACGFLLTAIIRRLGTTTHYDGKHYECTQPWSATPPQDIAAAHGALETRPKKYGVSFGTTEFPGKPHSEFLCYRNQVATTSRITIGTVPSGCGSCRDDRRILVENVLDAKGKRYVG